MKEKRHSGGGGSKETISEENGSTHFIYGPFYCHKQ